MTTTLISRRLSDGAVSVTSCVKCGLLLAYTKLQNVQSKIDVLPSKYQVQCNYCPHVSTVLKHCQ